MGATNEPRVQSIHVCAILKRMEEFVNREGVFPTLISPIYLATPPCWLPVLMLMDWLRDALLSFPSFLRLQHVQLQKDVRIISILRALWRFLHLPEYSEQTASQTFNYMTKRLPRSWSSVTSTKDCPSYLVYISNTKEAIGEMEAIKSNEWKCATGNWCSKFAVGYTEGSLPGYHASWIAS